MMHIAIYSFPEKGKLIYISISQRSTHSTISLSAVGIIFFLNWC